MSTVARIQGLGIRQLLLKRRGKMRRLSILLDGSNSGATGASNQ
jgi:hypothetical protein